ncbi:hypothetical protein TPA0910_22520 [Streptomyces hygroscopicus subsp. sporocinereus]|uniref:Uncharacterized protein n=1 Tax=Streptomyces hygroscopicus TaxID=1912 RepID=A0ABQ3TWY9_STRHY|nr:hypothetical protein [Streptomyces hygroscopicus]GHJ27819.1 hypothetical protein TPA0910_22520 [Streptomyces hygroscopicus]
MTTQAQQTTSPSAQQQGSHHFVLTLQKPHGQGFVTATFANTITPLPGDTRAHIYEALCKGVAQANPELADANVLFFSLEPNQL